MKRTKLFKIGECANYGKWRMTINTEANEVCLQGIDYFTDEIADTQTFPVQPSSLNDVMMYLEDNMWHYHADKMVQKLKEWMCPF